MNRRTFCSLVGASLVGGAGQGCRRQPPETPEAGLARLLNLEADEARWLDVLSGPERRDLHAALASGKPLAARDVDLLMKALGRRERVFAYVGYPQVTNSLSVCNGLLRE
jgi:hypothetical protein